VGKSFFRYSPSAGKRFPQIALPLMFHFSHEKNFGLLPKNAITYTRVLQKLTSKLQKAFSTISLQAEDAFSAPRVTTYICIYAQTSFLPFAYCRKSRLLESAAYLKLKFKPGKSLSAIRLPPENAFSQLALPLIFF